MKPFILPAILASIIILVGASTLYLSTEGKGLTHHYYALEDPEANSLAILSTRDQCNDFLRDADATACGRAVFSGHNVAVWSWMYCEDPAHKCAPIDGFKLYSGSGSDEPREIATVPSKARDAVLPAGLTESGCIAVATYRGTKIGVLDWDAPLFCFSPYTR